MSREYYLFFYVYKLEINRQRRITIEIEKATIPVINTEQMREVDRLMIESYGITVLQMMENAGRNLALLAKQMLGNDIVKRQI